MATIRPTWTEAQNLRTAAAVNASQSTEAENNVIDFDTLGADAARVFVDVVMGSATEILVEAFSSVDSGTSFATEPFFARTITANTDFDFLVLNMAHARIVISNITGGNSGLIGLSYAWRQWSSTP